MVLANWKRGICSGDGVLFTSLRVLVSTLQEERKRLALGSKIRA